MHEYPTARPATLSLDSRRQACVRFPVLRDVDSGTVNAIGGILQIRTSGTLTSRFVTQPEGTIQFNAAEITLDANSSISGAGSVLFSAGITTLAGTYNVYQTTIDGSRANFNTNAAVNVLTMNQGTLGGSAEVTVSDTLWWNGGIMSGGGTTTVADTADFFIQSATNQVMNASTMIGTRTINNNGTASWDGDGDLSFIGPGTFNNNGTFTALGSNNSIGSVVGAVFNNYGTFVASGGNLVIDAPFNNYQDGDLPGTVSVQTGNLTLQGGGVSTSEWDLTDGTSLTLQGQPYQFNSGTLFTYPQSSTFTSQQVYDGVSINGQQVYYRPYATVIINGITVTFQASVTLQNLQLQSGTLTGDGDVTVQNQMVWSAGSLAGNGSIAIGTLYTAGSSQRNLDREITSITQVAWIGGGAVTRSATRENFQNQSSYERVAATDFSSRPLLPGNTDIVASATRLRSMIVNPPVIVQNNTALGPTDPFVQFFENKPAIIRAAIAVAYNKWVGANHELATDLAGISSQYVTYLYVGRSNDISRPTPDFTLGNMWDVARGMIAGLGSGFWDSITGLPKLIYALVTSPIQTATGFYDAFISLKQAIGNGDLKTAAKLLVPELYELTQPNLNYYRQGYLIGTLIGKQAGSLTINMAAAGAATLLAGGVMRRLRGAGLLAVETATAQLAQVRRLLAGVPGLTRLENALQSTASNIAKAAQFQAARALYYKAQNKLKEIEWGTSRGGQRVDLLLTNNVMVETKNWPGFATLKPFVKTKKMKELKDQIRDYLRGNKNDLTIEFANSVPQEVYDMLETLPARLKNRVKVEAITFP